MDEKELVKRIRNSFRAKKSRAEVTRNLQKRGYKLPYVDALIKKAKKPKVILVCAVIALILIFSFSITGYSIFFSKQKKEVANPLAGFGATSGSRNSQIVSIDEIEIAPAFVSYLLNEIGAWKLRKNPFTFEKPMINLKVDEKSFYSIIDDSIQTFEGIREDADIEFVSTKQTVIAAMINENPGEVFKESIYRGETTLSLIAGKAELYVKGYLSLYDSLKD